MGELLSYRVRRLFNDRPNPTFTVRQYNKLINWGNGRAPAHIEHGFGRVLNSYDTVARASNKLVTFRQWEGKEGIRIPEFTTDRTVAQEWINGGVPVVCRTRLSGHSGDGIVLVLDNATPLAEAPLYVKYVKKQKEFRVHVVQGEVIDVQEKRKRSDLPEDFETNFQVRNHHTGWVYCRENIVEPDGLRAMAQAAVAHLELDFGAVDIIWNAKRNECCCLEVNTAPGLEGTTVNNYAEAFVKCLVGSEK